MVITYKLSKKPTKDTIKACDDGAKGMQELLVITAREVSPKLRWIVWLLTRFYSRKITDRAIEYDFYLI